MNVQGRTRVEANLYHSWQRHTEMHINLVYTRPANLAQLKTHACLAMQTCEQNEPRARQTGFNMRVTQF